MHHAYYLKTLRRLAGRQHREAHLHHRFPHGANVNRNQAAETRQAVVDGAVEVDMVVNISQDLSGQWDYVRGDIAAVTTRHAAGAMVKVIFENCYLKADQ